MILKKRSYYSKKEKGDNFVDNLIFLHFTSPVACSLSINGEFVKNSDKLNNRYISIATLKKTIYFTYQPISSNKTYLPFTQMLKISNNNVHSQSSYVQVIPFKNNHYEIALTPALSATNTISNVVFEEYFGKLNVVLLNNNSGNIFVYESNKLKKQLVTENIQDAIITQKQNVLVIKCSLENGFYLALLNVDTLEVILEHECDHIEDSDTEIKAMIKLYDIAKQAEVHTYNYETSKIDNYKVYLKESAIITKDKHLIPLAFLQAIKCDNLELARTYLSNELANAPEEFFADYFGSIQSIYFDRYNLDTADVYYTVLANDEYFKYEFTIDSGKIIEIHK